MLLNATIYIYYIHIVGSIEIDVILSCTFQIQKTKTLLYLLGNAPYTSMVKYTYVNIIAMLRL